MCVAWGSRGSIDEESIIVWVLTGRPASDSIFCSKDKRLLGLLQKKINKVVFVFFVLGREDDALVPHLSQMILRCTLNLPK